MGIVSTATNPTVKGITIAGAAIGLLGVIYARTKKALSEDLDRARGGPDRINHNTGQRCDEYIARTKKV